MPRARKAVTRSRSSALMAAAAALPSKIVAVTHPILPDHHRQPLLVAGSSFGRVGLVREGRHDDMPCFGAFEFLG